MPDHLHIVCPHCAAVNRVPDTRVGEQPKCGKCAGSLFTAKPQTLTATTVDRVIGRNDIPVLIDFWAPWCAPCRMMAPLFEQAAALLEPRIRLAKIDTEAEPTLGARFNIRSIPTLALFRNGREVAHHSGTMAAADIVRWVQAQR